MKTAKYIIFLLILLSAQIVSFAQEKFDIVAFTAPRGWQKEIGPNAVQFVRQDESKGIFAVMLLFKALPAGADSKANFNHSWKTIVAGSVTQATAPQMQPAAVENGWNVESGLAQYEKDGAKGVAMLLSASGSGRVVNLLVMTNTEAYQTDVENFIGSLVLPKAEPQKTAPLSRTDDSKTAGTAVSSDSAAFAGVWASYINETSGSSNGFPQTTGGYFRKEYHLRGDGTYVFLEKDFAAYSKTIVFKYETGRWSVSGNQLTIAPASGRVETWSKSASGRSDEWGSRLKTENAKLEKIAYAFEVKFLSGMAQTYLVLSHNAPTTRDGRQNNNGGENVWQYSLLPTGKSLIDSPPN